MHKQDDAHWRGKHPEMSNVKGWGNEMLGKANHAKKNCGKRLTTERNQCRSH